MGMQIHLIRHGESTYNDDQHVDHTAPQESGDQRIPLTEKGHEEARSRGEAIGPELIRNALIYCSPYLRTRQTLEGIVTGAGLAMTDVRVFEDPRLRELEHGFEGDKESVDDQKQLRKIHSRFFYRYKGGESPADCYDRVSTFLESLMRQMERKKNDSALIVTHSYTIRCFVMRFLHLKYEEFDRMKGPDNCGVATMRRRNENEEHLFTNGRWAVDGMTLR